MKAGDIVRLNSGSPEMTVTFVGDEVYLAYFLNGEIRTLHVPREALQKV